MKKIVQIVTSAVMSLSLLGVAPVALAATNSTTPSSAPASTTTETKKTLKERVADYKAKQTTKLTIAQETALKAKCKAAQLVGKTLTAKVVATTSARTKVYDEITKNLVTITGRITDADVDTSELTTLQTELKKLIAAYTVSAESYKVTLTDLGEIDCIVDPVAFQATLDAARTNRAVVAKDATAIRTFVTETIKPALTAAQETLTTNAAPDKTSDQKVKE